MPLDFICRFRCDRCGVEHGDVGRVAVESWPIRIDSFAILRPPPGWVVTGPAALCPEHAAEATTLPPEPSRVVKPSPLSILAAAKNRH